MVSPRFDVLPNFITENERQQFIRWFDKSLEDDENLVTGYTVCDGIGGDISTRKTTRTNPNKVNFPEIAYEVFQRVRDHYGFAQPNAQARHDGMIAVAIMTGGDTYLHRDPGTAVTFNIVIQQAESGGELYFEGEKKDTPEAALHSYAPCSHYHQVSEVMGNRNRYLWIFRIKVAIEDWDAAQKWAQWKLTA